MPQYDVYACRWDDAHVVEEIIPARGLEMSFPLSDHGECSFSATVELARTIAGVTIARCQGCGAVELRREADR